MRGLSLVVVVVVANLLAPAARADEPALMGFAVEWPAVRLWEGAAVEGVKVRAVDEGGATVAGFAGEVTVRGLTTDGQDARVTLAGGAATLPAATVAAAVVEVSGGGKASSLEVPVLPGVLSLLPALVAIALALLLRQVLLALLGGVWVGAALLYGGALTAFPRTLDVVIKVAADADKLKVVTFTLLIGALVGVVAQAGGTKGVVELVSRVARTQRSGSLAAWAMGLVVFFDDYASTLLVGNTMRPITDKLRISREKLSYIVDSTAAPIASLAVVSTWIGYEVSVLGEAMKASGLAGEAWDPYRIFLAGIPSRFYPIFALAFVAMVAITGRDFGPMWKAERRALREGKVLRDGGAPLMDASVLEEGGALDEQRPRAWIALAAILGLVVAVITGLFVLGPDASYDALLYGSGFGALLSVTLAVASGALSLEGALNAFVRGVRAMALAVLVLVLAWAIGKVMGDLRAGQYVASLLGTALPAWTLPAITFLLAALMALATGTSWGTMAILFPIVVPVVSAHQGAAGFEALLIGTSSAVLAGAVFGDHCSPISDTTVLSSIASAADHVDHTRTQAPYALVCAGASIGIGYVPLGLGLSPWISLPLGLVALWATLRILGRPVASS